MLVGWGSWVAWAGDGSCSLTGASTCYQAWLPLQPCKGLLLAQLQQEESGPPLVLVYPRRKALCLPPAHTPALCEAEELTAAACFLLLLPFPVPDFIVFEALTVRPWVFRDLKDRK